MGRIHSGPKCIVVVVIFDIKVRDGLLWECELWRNEMQVKRKRLKVRRAKHDQLGHLEL